MFTLNDFNKLTKRIKGKIQLIIGRAVLAAVKNTEKTQKVQVVALYDETITNIERFQEYGFETFPKKEAEVLINFISGNRDQGIVVCIHDRRYRLLDLTEGDVAVYTYEDQGADKHRVHLKAGRAVDIIGKDIVAQGESVLIGADTGHKPVCHEDLIAAINTIISTYNTHIHTVAAAPGPTTVPTTVETPLVKLDYITKETQLT